MDDCIPIDPVVAQIDKAVQIIAGQSDQWRFALEQLMANLPDTASALIRQDIQNLLDRTIASAGVQFACQGDIFGRRLQSALAEIRRKVTSNNPEPTPVQLPPMICSNPGAIEMATAPEKWNTVRFTGYDLDHTDMQNRLVQVYSLDSQGGREALPEERIGRTSHYALTLNLAGMERSMHEKKVLKIELVWNGLTLDQGQIVITPWVPSDKHELKPLGSIDYVPPKTHGDADFDTGDDEPTDFRVCAKLQIEPSRIMGAVDMWAREKEPDNTTVEGDSGWKPLYSAPANYRIVDIRPTEPTCQESRIRTHGWHDYDRLPGAGVASKISVWIDGDGDEAGKRTRARVDFKSAEVHLEELAPPWLR